MIKKIKYYLNEIATTRHRLDSISMQIDELKGIVNEIKAATFNDLKSPKINLGQIQSQLNNQKEHIDNLSEVEFQVFSQFGDDGIIQYLINKIDIPNKTFIEFGVENYTESNTRFLLYNNNWTGYIMDGSEENMDYVEKDIQNWTSELYVETAFIDTANINQLLTKSGFDTQVGILSIDVDGNDYWIWKAIDCINPVIVIIEYNSLFGKNTTWTVPYDPSFDREQKHHSRLYFGASLKALELLGKQKGYSLIGSNGKGNNAYFIRNDKLGNFIVKPAEEAYVLSKFRETIINGKRVTGLDRIKLIEGLDVIDIETGLPSKVDASFVQY